MYCSVELRSACDFALASEERWRKTGCEGVNGCGGNKGFILERYEMGVWEAGAGLGVEGERPEAGSIVIGGGEGVGTGSTILKIVE